MTRLSNWQLFAIAVLIWGTTWHAIVYQLAQATPEFGVALRFTLASVVVLALAWWRGERMRFAPRAQALLALQGVFMYSLAYLCVYHAERHVPSGLVAVGYSASPLIAGIAAQRLWSVPISSRFLVGGMVGVLGVALIFAPELAALESETNSMLGLTFTVGAVLLSAVGSLAASRNAGHGLPFWPALGIGLGWGAAASWAVVLIQGPLPALPTAWSWWLSLAYLVGAGTVLAFAAYLTLQQRLGPGKASTIGVATPVLALAVSTAFEGYRPDVWTLAGIMLAVVGNLMMLRR